MSKLWASALGGEVFYADDLPACCMREARGSREEFECASCGAVWQVATAPEPEGCAFVEFVDEERRGAA